MDLTSSNIRALLGGHRFQIEGPVELVGVVRAAEKRQQFEPKNQSRNISVWAYRLAPAIAVMSVFSLTLNL